MANSTYRTLQADAIDGLTVNKNFITNGSATVNTSGWSTYADAAGTSPVDGTGGSPTVTWTSSSTSPLTGDNSFLLTKDASNRQGEGASYDFTIDSAFQAKVLQIEFDYILSSGTFTAGTSSADSDVTVWIYDVTNAVVIQPTTYKLYSNNSSISEKFISNFQTSSNSTSYRLIIHCGSTSASAYVLKFDRIRVTPSQYVHGTPITDWVSWTPTGSWSTNTTYAGRKRRVGDVGEYDVVVSVSGAPTAANLTINMPSGETIDTAKLPDTTSGLDQLGTGWVRDSGGLNYGLAHVAYSSSTVVLVRYSNASATATGTNLLSVSNTAPMTFASGDQVILRYSAPIAGWSSSVQTSDQSESRVVAARAKTTNAQAISNGATNVISTWTTEDYDTHSAFDTSTGVFTVPVAGWYKVSAAIASASTAWTTASNRYAALNLAGSISAQIGFMQVASSVTNYIVLVGTTTQYYNAGQTISVSIGNATGSTFTLSGASAENHISIERVSQASLISATETVAFNVYGATTTIGTSATDVVFPTKVKDTHGAYNASTGVFTVPVAGWYSFQWRGQSGSAVTASATDSGTTLTLTINGTDIASGQTFVYQVTSVSLSPRITGSATVYCSAGDAVKITGARAAGVSSYSLTGTQNATYFCGSRIGI